MLKSLALNSVYANMTVKYAQKTADIFVKCFACTLWKFMAYYGIIIVYIILQKMKIAFEEENIYE